MLRIRTAGIDDLAAVTGLGVLLWPEVGFKDMRLEMEEFLSKENTMIALCFDGSTPAGFAMCALRHDFVEGTESSPVGYLEGIFVKEAYRRQGVGESLLRYCELWAKEKGCTEFGSDCELDNTDSLHFHLKVGFFEANRVICLSKKI